MRVLVQRVTRASVHVSGELVSEIGAGLLLFVGIAPGDGAKEVNWMAKKIAGLRVFEDLDGKMNQSLLEVGGAALAVSQFTLYGDCRRGRRPSFQGAAPPELAAPLFDDFVAALDTLGVPCKAGVFQATMEVNLLNHGPVTLWIDTEEPKK